jgi:hypothetical protein
MGNLVARKQRADNATASRIALATRAKEVNRSIAFGRPAPMPRIARPSEISSSAPISIAIKVGCRLKGLKTPIPISIVSVASAHAVAAGSTPRWNGFSANQTVA